jgi:uncharacterized membrane protein YjgN (DUF898 family)
MDKVGEQLPAIGTTVAGLILVFLGMIFTSWESYDTGSKNSVRFKFRKRAWTSFFAFICAILSAVFGLIGVGTDHKCPWPDYVGAALLALSGIVMAISALATILEI